MHMRLLGNTISIGFFYLLIVLDAKRDAYSRLSRRVVQLLGAGRSSTGVFYREIMPDTVYFTLLKFSL